ncbi:protein kinase [Streptomyces sp. RB6PN25]|uniref:non-specific serine/threonine protein kinase n=1 Tax=Streptomyces humicola TaxID=2953240 RepID=A0ABT1PQG3_9ACTN|nr:protein kinase [Streptomyces humicola]
MGMVCRAVDEVLGREVAVKELRTFSDASSAELADLRLRMQREARAAARIRHSGVISVYDVAEEDGRPIIVMELVDGPSLDDVVQERGVLDPREAAAIGAEVADALGAAHRVGVLHRDVKPGNILLERGGRVVLTDFGIATMDDPGDGTTSNLTQSGQLVGSLDFLAPERAQGQQPGPASDIWSLGATLYAAVEGTSPFRRTSAWSTMTAIVTEPLPEPRRAGPLTPVLRELMDKDAQTRPDAQRARQLLAAVAQGTSAPPATPDTAATDLHTAMLRPRGEQPHSPVPPQSPRTSPTDADAGQERATRPDLGWRPPAAAGAGSPRPPVIPEQAPGSARRRRRLAVAAATTAVVLAGAGVTWAMAGHSGSSGSGRNEAQPTVSGVNLPVEAGSGQSPAPSRSTAHTAPRASASRSGRPAPGDRSQASAGGAAGGSNGGRNGGGGSSGPGGSSGGNSGTGGSAPTPSPKPTANPEPWKSCNYYSGTQLTQYGDTGERVVEVQCILQARGYSVGSSGVDGNFGPDTRTAVERFQSDHHLTVDGQVGVNTWAALRA